LDKFKLKLGFLYFELNLTQRLRTRTQLHRGLPKTSPQGVVCVVLDDERFDLNFIVPVGHFRRKVRYKLKINTMH
jgi:hypothetical protein